MRQSLFVNRLRQLNDGCFNATVIKLFAAICMTIDHIGAYGNVVPQISIYTNFFRLIGRVAAPLFLYFVIESIKFTHDKKKFLCRMYIAAVCTGLCNAFITKYIFLDLTTFGNIYHSYVWVILIIFFIDNFIAKILSKQWWVVVLYIILTLIVAFLCDKIDHFFLNYKNLEMIFNIKETDCFFIHNLIDSIFISLRRTEYSAGFVLLGITWYYLKKKRHRCIALGAFCGISIFIPVANASPYLSIFSSSQWAMICAIPVIALYNGQRGRGIKNFFYVYYPVHCYLIAFFADVLYQRNSM